jgi:ppGpp synthetase/RelA/SpoT-type nucleotidyltranferase
MAFLIMAKVSLNHTERNDIDEAVSAFVEKRSLFQTFAEVLLAYFQHHTTLAEQVHFIKHRIKNPEHLRGKLERKVLEGKANGEPFNFDAATIFEKIHDLAGIRIIHLNTEQMRIIHPALLEVFGEQKLRLVEDVTANCWDVEYERFYTELGIAARSRDTMYTTVHYVVEANQRTKITCEIQVRTLMDEVWGEVSHRLNYPIESSNRACADQLKVLARFTTGCARLVDSIFKSNEESVG